jgi:hypothetical protein
MAPSTRFEVRLRVRGQPGPTWAEVFDDLVLTAGTDGITVIGGEVVDQAALHGLVAAIRDLGLSLVSIEAVAIDGSQTN